MPNNILSLHVTSSQDHVNGTPMGNLDIENSVNKGPVGSGTSYHLGKKFVVIHRRKARNLNEFSFCLHMDLWIKHESIRLET